MRSIAFGVLLGLAVGPAAAEELHVAPVTAFYQEKIAVWLSDPAVVDAVKAQNEKTKDLSEADIKALDDAWRAEVEAADRPTIAGMEANPLSAFLKAKKDELGGLATELFVMDARGLNVGLSDVTSDYWQGDEAKWQKTFSVGPGTVFVDEIEKDESTQSLQSQVSGTIVDPATGAAIGAITVGVDVDGL